MGKQFQREEEPQLYTFVRNLGFHVPNADELGRLVGYSTINSLINFSTNSGSPQEREFQQVKAVHAGLERLLKEAANKESFIVLCELELITDPTLVEYLNNPNSYTGNSDILTTILKRFTINRRNYKDKIRRHGSAVCEETRQRGIIYGTKNILVTDYRTIQNAFK
jgi:hypothetical protein